ncbi:23S rRNA (pseudouridine(1915)-N(3))-methyltransferase RlmH [Salibacter halophilus]|uniref:Ribosomal RNA large subunit methyltransferase H n=1 Tax=Salibacter halophilus TaxID=1803916 RepID=A0A6N6M1T3_9FLAO|nr:23S rRNA (pseudouridine(1915)-N(3))-methyltransferase RlmH [Salibacter halophilus]KAB1062673.1 23S rRNA (pseudouridine(1915)-N(3))-methyltransferase RlmH [Salibacter halophilus]
MRIKILAIGKTRSNYLNEGIDLFLKRLQHYVNVELKNIPDVKGVKNLSTDQQKEKEGEFILKELSTSDRVYLLDEKGKEYTSKKFARFIEKQQVAGYKQIVFLVGGPYGFSQSVYQRADGKIQLSSMTFSHEMVRLFFVEQLYRAYTILNNEPYHHE